MNIEIRKALERDFEFVCSMIKQLNGVSEETEILEDQKLKDIFLKHLISTSKFCYVAEVSGISVGFMSCSLDLVLSEIGEVLIIDELVVDEKSHGTGVGRALIDCALRFAKSRGCYLVQATTNFRNKGTHQFYEKVGFNKNGYRFQVDV